MGYVARAGRADREIQCREGRVGDDRDEGYAVAVHTKLGGKGINWIDESSKTGGQAVA